MKAPLFVLITLLGISAVSLAEANGKWLEKVPKADQAKVNPDAGQAEAIAAGRNLFVANCSHCHGQNAEGKGSQPSLHSERIRTATDGDIAWLLKNGEVYKGMPRWSGLPEQQRWQIVTYIRSLNP
jgi:mono/diheme cytochrome c family protein